LRVLEYNDIKSIPQVRLVQASGENVIVPTSTAWREAQDVGLDLIMVSDEATVPPVVRIMDFKKIQFEKKKAKTQNKVVKKHKSELKEIQLKTNISDHDLGTKVNAIDRFLERGDKVKVVIRLKGRERENPQRAMDLLEKVATLIKIPHKYSRVEGPVTTGMFEATGGK
jgi:translation initiation factor IF-3